jgi:hypothetical protein
VDLNLAGGDGGVFPVRGFGGNPDGDLRKIKISFGPQTGVTALLPVALTISRRGPNGKCMDLVPS